ncbi:gliding motility-associated C-terminal domain-containing protein [Leptobacterium sp. I13]|uniref:gliding motility-associated C-terminal domain-containing protein n=1 Tax=Leptobacterium meishanense TaxID=3128904 RepID=UPI0030EE05DD
MQKRTIHILLITTVLTMFGVSVLYSQHHNLGIQYNGSGGVMSIFSNYTNSGTQVNNGEIYYYGNWTNDNEVNFTPGTTTGQTYYISTSPQTLSGVGITSEFYNITINNPSAPPSIILNTDIVVFGNLDFMDGVVDADDPVASGLLQFQDNATHSSTGNASFVDGPVHKTGNDAFTFPIGDQTGGSYTYRPAGISAPGATTEAYQAQYHFTDPTIDGYDTAQREAILEEIDAQEYWEIDQLNGSTNVSITLSWDTTVPTTPSTLTADPTTLTIALWDGTQWIDQGGTINMTNNTITTTPISYGVFTLARVCAPPTPVGDTLQEPCIGDNPTVADIEATTVSGTTIVWYDAPTGGNVVDPATPLTDGATYYAEATDDTLPSRCVSSIRLAVTINLDPDCDDDGVLDVEEQPTDTDGDGIPDYLDPDDDGDGVPTAEEDTNRNGDWFDDDCDRDGTADYLDENSCFVFPNAFSPNGDGFNDTFEIPILASFPNFRMQIFNQYGSKVYDYRHDGSSTPQWWDGTSNNGLTVSSNEGVPVGTYFYIIEFNDGEREPIDGWVYLNR